MQIGSIDAGKIVKGVSNPSKSLNTIFSKLKFKYRYSNGIDVMKKDWDNLLILDACRYDIFKERNLMKGELDFIVSSASDSRTFLKKNFAGKDLHDTVYVTANPFVELIDDGVFFDVYYKEVMERWDEEINTVHPEEVVDVAIAAHNDNPNKRLIVHFMQPHAPYIGDFGIELNERVQFGKHHPDLDGYKIPDIGIAGAVKTGQITESELRQAYVENVEIVLKHAEKLVSELNGKSVVTADHGEMLGERVFLHSEYGHRPYLYTPELRIVPWFICEYKTRKQITEDPPKEFSRLNEQIRKDHLESLGYYPK